MSDHARPILFVLLVLVLATIACDGSTGEVHYPKTMGWALAPGELTSHALDRWRGQFPSCNILNYKASITDKVDTISVLFIEYEC